jgi:thiamine-monophosphate kinase
MNEKDPKLSDIGEFGFIESIKENCHFSSDRPVMGIGDDCAVIGPYDGKVLLITTDLLVEGIHFVLEKIDPVQLGRKVIAVNLSDIAAMGGKPVHGVISIAIPKTTALETIQSIYSGIKDMCRKYRVNLLGGDTSASPDRLVINAAIIGEATENEVLYRGGAKPGDRIYVTGTLGDSAAGLKITSGDASAPDSTASILIQSHNSPVPFLEAGKIIAKSKLAGSMIDLSDGLISDLRHICQASGVGARLFSSSIPLSKEVGLLAEINRFDPYQLALYGGEDYRLLVTVPPVNSIEFESLFVDGRPCHIYKVGEITLKKDIRIVMDEGREEAVQVKGYDHFY